VGVLLLFSEIIKCAHEFSYNAAPGRLGERHYYHRRLCPGGYSIGRGGLKHDEQRAEKGIEGSFYRQFREQFFRHIYFPEPIEMVYLELSSKPPL
jgi:hypothetical protein